ncbi:MAG: BadF/BadG/BcrA/BcrD ATPase family protein [Paenibacillaceae bacterium]
MNYYLGIDAGGSKTYALLVDEDGRIVGRGSSGNGNHQIDYKQASDNIQAAACSAMIQAGIGQADLTFAFFGLAGADREVDFRILNPLIRDLGFTRFEIACDTMIGLRAGSKKPYGVSVICGTGTNCAGKNQAGDFYQCGGYDYMYGDFGGGGALNVEVFRSVIRAWDGREQATLLTPLLLKALNYGSVDAMFNDYLDHEKLVPLEVAKLLFKAAEQGDEVALTIVRKQGEELGKSATAVIRRLCMEQASFDVVLAGSILTRGDTGVINERITHAVRQVAPQANVIKLTIEPVVGAVWLAIEASGGVVTEQIALELKQVMLIS